MKRILACSDIHGEIDKLYNVLDEANYHPKQDILVLLGDYIDRGYYSKEVMEYVMELVRDGAIALMGNHEKLFVDSLYNEDMRDVWIANGGLQTLDSYDYDMDIMEKHANWMKENLRMYYETEKYIFVHAGMQPQLSLEWQSEEDLLWSRHFEPILLGKTVIQGHTPFDEVEFIHDRIFIDTGACMGGKLSLLELPSLHIYED